MPDQQHRRSRPSQTTAVQAQPAAIDLIELMYRLLASWKLILCLALVLAIISGIYTLFIATPKYEATSTIYVLSNRDSALNLSDIQLGTALAQDYIKVFKMWEVHQQVISNLDLPYAYHELMDMLTLTNDPGTRMLDITFTSPDASEAAAAANEYAKVASQYIADTMSTQKPNIMSEALVPANPVSPNVVRSIIAGFLLGAMLACGYVTVSLVLDDKYKTAEDIKKYAGLTTLAVVPFEPVENRARSRRNG